MSRRHRAPKRTNTQSREPEVAPNEDPATAQTGAASDDATETVAPTPPVEADTDEHLEFDSDEHPSVAIEDLGLSPKAMDQVAALIARSTEEMIERVLQVQQGVDGENRPMPSAQAGLNARAVEDDVDAYAGHGRVHADVLHRTHDQEVHPESLHGNPQVGEQWTQPGVLPDIKPRPGMDQKWCRVELGGKADVSNERRFIREGWRPRPIDTIPGEVSVTSMDQGALSKFLVVQDLILCEMPKERIRQRQAYYERENDKFLDIADAEIIKANEQRQGIEGLGLIHRAHSTHIGTGKVPTVAADEEL